MTPKEKAFELITKFQHPMSDMSDTDCFHIEVAKEFSLIAVDEILNANPNYPEFKENEGTPIRYWEVVKQEIENL